MLTHSSRPGWIGSHIAHEALAAGLKIKLTIRDNAKAQTLIDALEKIHGKQEGHIETVTVTDFTNTSAFDEAVKGVHGIVHAASDLTFSSNPDEVIPWVIKAYENLLSSAHRHGSAVRRFVLTSSSSAIGLSNPGGKTTQHFDTSTWNDAAVEKMKTAPDGISVYAASKVLSERAAWAFAEKEKPAFVLTSINPNANFGAAVPGTPLLTTGKWIPDAANGHTEMLQMLGPQWSVDVNDVARLHVIALTREDVKNERILAFGERFTINSIIDTINKVLGPDGPKVNRIENGDLEDNTTVDVSRANELLRDQGGLRDLEYSIRQTLKPQ